MPKCATCKVEKTPENTYANPARAGGFGPYCRACTNARQRAAYARRTLKFDIDVEEVTPEAPPATPLEAANQHYERVTKARDERQERLALLEENARLKGLLDDARGIRAGNVPVILKTDTGKSEAVACMVASDWHVEEPVEPALVHGLNTYNLEVAKSRSENFFRNGLRLADICARDSRIERIWVGLLGDFFSGYLHEELQENNLLAPAAAANFVLELLASGLDYLLRESKYILDVDCISGNHGRMTRKPRHGDIAGTSLESFMYAALASRYEGNPRVNFRVAQGEMLYRAYFGKFNMRLLHGNQIGYQGGVGGITIPVRKALARWDKGVKADLTVLGHFHQRQDGGDFLANGSLIGYNGYAQSIGASPEQPQQSFFLIHSRGGGQKSIVAPIWLDEG